MTQDIIICISNYISQKLREDEIDYTFRVGYSSQFANKSITLRIINNSDNGLYLNMTQESTIQIGFNIKSKDQMEIYDLQNKLNDYMDDIRFLDQPNITIYSMRNTYSSLINLTEEDTYVGDIQFTINYIDKKLRKL